MAKPIMKVQDFAAHPVRVVAERKTPQISAIGEGAIEWADSPAKLLHERLVATFVEPQPVEVDDSFSPRAKLAILLGSSAVLWLAIGLAVAAIA